MTANNSSLSSSLDMDEFPHQMEEPYFMTIIRLVLFGILFLTAVIGNAFVFTAPLRNARLRTFNYYLITCLALGDFISTLGLPFTLATEQLGSRWIFGRFMCQVLNPSQVVCGMVTTNVHTAISVDRFTSVVYPFKGKPHGLRQRLIIALIWITAIFCALPAYGARKLFEYNFEGGESFLLCAEAFPAYKYEHMYSLFLLVVNYALPILIMSVLYTKVILKLRQAGRYRHERGCSLASDGDNQTPLERKFIRMTFIIMLVFVLCYLPYQVVFLLTHFEILTQLSYGFIIFDYAYLVTWIPNAINPLVYGAMDRYYAKAYRKLFNCLSRGRDELKASYIASTLKIKQRSERLSKEITMDPEHETMC